MNETNQANSEKKSLIQLGCGDFSKEVRILKGHEFRYLKEHGQSIVGKSLVLAHTLAPDEKTRLGIIVTKKFNKRAVKRNRAYRIVRESFRLIKECVKESTWLVVIARKQLEGKSAVEVQNELLELLQNEKLVKNSEDFN